MSDITNKGIKTGSFDTWSKTAPKQAAGPKAVQVKVDNRAATRQAIIVELRDKGFTFKTRSDWRAKDVAKTLESDWDYKGIALHHAGNSYSCSADGSDQLRKAEATDIDSFGHISYHYAIDCQGIIYEALDIRYKGAHIEKGNSGVIGVVFLADLSIRGESNKYGPAVLTTLKDKGFRAGLSEWIGRQKDALDTSNDKGTDLQHKAASALLRALKQYFPITTLGAHREFAKTKGMNRPCPGAWGMVTVDILRQELCLLAP